MNNTKAILIVVSAILLSIFMHRGAFTLPIQGKDTWRQSKTAWNIRYFVRHDANILHPRQPYLNDGDNIVRYEFPIMQWGIAMIEKITGEHIFVMRLTVYLISLLTLFAVFKIAFLLTGDMVISAIALWIFSFLPTFFYNATSIMPDVLALCFGMFYVLYFLKHLTTGDNKDLLWSAVFISLAGLAKLPFILLGTLSLIRFVEITFTKNPDRWRQWIRFALINTLALLPVLAWYAIVVPAWKENNIQAGFMKNFVGWPLFNSFLKNQLLVNFPMEILNLPALLLLLIGIYYLLRKRMLFLVKFRYFFIPLLLLFMYFFYVLNVIREGHEYYLMPFYPIFLLGIILGVSKAMEWNKYVTLFAWLLILIMPLVCWRREGNYWDIKYAYFNADFFTCRDQLSSIGTRDDIAVFINDQSLAILPYIADKTGFVFWNDHLPVLWLKDMIKNQHAQYLYSDSRPIEAQEGFSDCIAEMVLECGTLRVYRLKAPADIQL